MRKLFILLAVLAIVAVTDARVPKVGDYVLIDSGRGGSQEGTIKDISNGLICLNITREDEVRGLTMNFTEDACFGIGSIRILEWPGTAITTMNFTEDRNGR